MTIKQHSADIDDFDTSQDVNQWLISVSRKRRPKFMRSSTCSTAASDPLPGTCNASMAETASLMESESESKCEGSVMLGFNFDYEARVSL